MFKMEQLGNEEEAKNICVSKISQVEDEVKDIKGWHEPYDGRLSRTVPWEAWAEMPLPTRLLDLVHSWTINPGY